VNKERINIMFYHNSSDNSIEVDYPWFRPICAKLTFDEDNRRYTFAFNKNYLRVSRFIGGGWRPISILRTLLQMNLVRNNMLMMHGGVVRIGDEGILMPSVENTGKTKTVWMLAKRGAQYVTDEYSIIDSEGHCYGIPSSSSLTPATATAVGLNVTRREKTALILAGLKGKALTVHFTSGGMRMDPNRFFKICSETHLNRIAIIQNGPDLTRRIRTEEALSRIKATQLFEFGWKTHPYLLAYAYFNPEFEVDSYSSQEDDVLKSVVSRIQDIYLVSSSNREHYRSIENLFLDRRHEVATSISA